MSAQELALLEPLVHAFLDSPVNQLSLDPQHTLACQLFLDVPLPVRARKHVFNWAAQLLPLVMIYASLLLLNVQQG
jgi:hypothetical protein